MDYSSYCRHCHDILTNPTVCCTCCTKYYHLRCTPIDENEKNEWSSWTCSECVSIFPYHDIDDDGLVEDMACNSRLTTVSNHMYFNPFDLHSHSDSKFIDPLDPDSNFFSSLTPDSLSCDYFSIEQFHSLLLNIPEPQPKQFSTFHLNIRSLSKNHEALYHFLSLLNHEFSVLALSETWLNEEVTSLFDIPNYNALHYCRKAKSGGGVSLYLHNKYQFKQRDDLALSSECYDAESLFLEIPSCDIFHCKCVVIGCIYKPPDSNIEHFNTGLACVMEKINREGKICFLLGDYNINLFSSESSSLPAEFLNTLYANSLYPLITIPTRVTSSSATLIDNIFTNSLNNVWKSGVFHSDISDHYPVFHFTSKTSVNHQEADKVLRFRVFNKRNMDRFEEMVDDILWDDVYTHNDVEQAYQSFFKSFNSVFNRCFPPVSKKANKVSAFSKPWFTQDLHKSLKAKNRLYKKYISNPSPTNIAN